MISNTEWPQVRTPNKPIIIHYKKSYTYRHFKEREQLFQKACYDTKTDAQVINYKNATQYRTKTMKKHVQINKIHEIFIPRPVYWAHC